MVSLKKYVLCKCGASNSFEFSSDMPIEDVSVSARCPACGSSIHISVSSMLSAQPAVQVQSEKASQESALPKPQASEETKENVEQALRDLFR
ncbi:MAG: hypothetical protein QW275_03315 [Candidatus Anstonellaceae archaeon]